MKPEAWTTTGEEGEEQWDQYEVRSLFRKIVLSSLGRYLSGSNMNNNAA